jgi:hypothetical protein
MEILPNEIIYHIYTFLDLQNKLFFSMVNSEYYYLLNPSLFKLKKSEIIEYNKQKYNRRLELHNLLIVPLATFGQFKIKKFLKCIRAKISIYKSVYGQTIFRICKKKKIIYNLEIYYNYPAILQITESDKKNVEATMEMFRLMKLLSLDKKLHHLQLPIYLDLTNQITFFSKAKNIPENYKPHYQCMIDSKPNFLLAISKPSCSLEYLIRHSVITLKMWKIIIFQVLYTFAKIQTLYPSFRYNIAGSEYIHVSQIPEKYKESKLYSIYKIKGFIFKIPIIRYYITLNDFQFASIGGIVENDVYLLNGMEKYKEYNSEDRFFDMYTFLNSIRRGCVPKQIIDFIDKIIGPSYNIISKTTPYYIITTDSFFKEFRYGNKLCQQCNKNYKNTKCTNKKCGECCHCINHRAMLKHMA